MSGPTLAGGSTASTIRLSGFSTFTFAGGLFSGTVAADPEPVAARKQQPEPGQRRQERFRLSVERRRLPRLRRADARAPERRLHSVVLRARTLFTTLHGLGGSRPTRRAGWGIYIVDLTTLGCLERPASVAAVRSGARQHARRQHHRHRLDAARRPSARPLQQHYVDRVRVPSTSISTTIRTRPTARWDRLARNFAGSSYSLNVGALAPGNYYVAIRRNNPVGRFCLLSRLLSGQCAGDDYRHGAVGRGQRRRLRHDVPQRSLGHGEPGRHRPHVNLSSVGIRPGDRRGNGSRRRRSAPVLGASSGPTTLGVFSPNPCQSFSKPAVFPLHRNVRGAMHHIDPTRYRILTAEVRRAQQGARSLRRLDLPRRLACGRRGGRKPQPGGRAQQPRRRQRGQPHQPRRRRVAASIRRARDKRVGAGHRRVPWHHDLPPRPARVRQPVRLLLSSGSSWRRSKRRTPATPSAGRRARPTARSTSTTTPTRIRRRRR